MKNVACSTRHGNKCDLRVLDPEGHLSNSGNFCETSDLKDEILRFIFQLSLTLLKKSRTVWRTQNEAQEEN